MVPRTLLMVCGLLLVTSVSARAVTIRVPADQPTIQAGIDAANPSDIVLVAPDTYTGPDNKNLDFHGKDIEVRSEGGPEVTIIDCEGVGRAFNLLPPLTSAAVVDGFTIRNGDGNGGAPEGGGGMIILGCSPSISHCIFTENTAAGGIGGGGGAIGFIVSSSVITNCTFIGNLAVGNLANGGAMACHASPVTVTDCFFGENRAGGEGGGMAANPFQAGSSASAAAPLTSRANSISTVTSCTFRRNEARSGGGLAIIDGAVDDCDFVENIAISGGGIRAFEATITRCSILDNVASGDGGGVGGGTVSDCVISGNAAGGDGGGAAFAASLTGCVIFRNTAARGGGIGQSTMVQNCTIYGNTAGTGSGAWIFSSDIPITMRIEKSIIASNGSGEAVSCGGLADAVLSCSDVFGNAGGDWVGCIAGQNGVNGNIAADPLFCDAPGGNFTLSTSSPCAPENSGTCGLIGAQPVGCGATALESMTWGKVKARYGI